MNVTITPGTANVTVVAYAPNVMMRKALYMLMYEVAKNHRDEANKVSGKNETEEINNSMVCILFCYTCLEAFINTIGKDKLGDSWANYKNNKLEGKWRGVSNALSTRKSKKQDSVFNKGEEPFKSFLELKRIRDFVLVHRQAEFKEFVETKYGVTEETINTLKSENADWACQTVKDMVNKLAKCMEDAPSIEWVK